MTPDQLQTAIKAFGFEKARQRGSHIIYRHPKSGATISSPHKRLHIRLSK